jgi:AAA+ superfamily predicted ATPase
VVKLESWYETIALKFRASVSNVIIALTSDFERIDQFFETVKSGDINKLLFKDGKHFENLLLYDLQRNKCFEAVSNMEISPSSPFGGLLETIDQKLRGSRTFLMVYYAFLPRHVDLLVDYLGAWSQDSNLYANHSKVLVFASPGFVNLSNFPSSLLNLVYNFDIPLPNEEERKALLEELVRQANSSEKIAKPLTLTQQHIVATAGLNLHEIKTSFLESLIYTQDISIPIFTSYKIKILQDNGLLYIEPSRGFESVGGYEYLKNYISTRIIAVLKNPERAGKLGLRIPKGLLLYGPPGCGKTFLAKAFAKELGLPMITLSPADLLRGIVGETEARTRQLVTLIESLAPVIVFIDEFDQLAIARDRAFMGDSGVSRRMQNMLLEWLGDEKRKAFIVGATNFVGSLDPAFIRPGRIDEVILMLYPDHEARKGILEVQTRIKKVPTKDVDFGKLADATFLFSGAELEKLVLEAAARAFIKDRDYVTQEDFTSALEIFKINIDERLKRTQEMIQEISSLESVNQAFLRESLKALARAERDERLHSVLENL